ncbi:hypothetical protein [Desulfovibrio sp. Huiquan2017]|uniref:hypothetical protein n=1 Tax=Desulfovibrio sp. Huiquan2017 TaxID=2816861 RepID=UPI001A92D28B|nr:hypothetical protein [Desulfovibrio sp. Huiquan2017]
MSLEKLTAWLCSVVGSPEHVNVAPEAVLKDRVTYQNWNMALVMSYVVKALCVAIAAYIEPETTKNGWWILGFTLTGMVASGKLSLEILAAQRNVDKLIFERMPNATRPLGAYRKMALDRVIAATVLDVVVCGTLFISILLADRLTGAVNGQEIALAAAACVVLPLAIMAGHFVRRPMERRILFGISARS